MNDIISITSESLIILDAWGNNGASSTHNEGNVTITNVLSSSKESNIYPSQFSIDKIYPNPFNPITKISFSVPINSENIKISVFDILGNLQTELTNEIYDPGSHTINWDASQKSSGIYFIEFKGNNFREVKKVSLIK